jgi:hypothetical protein
VEPTYEVVMPGQTREARLRVKLDVPGIHVFSSLLKQDVNARQPGHDGREKRDNRLIARWINCGKPVDECGKTRGKAGASVVQNRATGL